MPARAALAFESAMRWGSMSTPTPRAPNRWAAVMTIRPSAPEVVDDVVGGKVRQLQHAVNDVLRGRHERSEAALILRDHATQVSEGRRTCGRQRCDERQENQSASHVVAPSLRAYRLDPTRRPVLYIKRCSCDLP